MTIPLSIETFETFEMLGVAAPAQQTEGDDFLSSAMALMVDAVCVVDADGVFLFISAAGRRIFGYTQEEMLGRSMIDFVCAEDRERTLNRVNEIVAGKPHPHFENRYVRKDGTLVHINWSAHWSESRRLRVAVARDVTERRRAESIQAALYAVSEAAHNAEDLLALFRQVHEIVGGLLPAINFFVALYDEAADELSFPYFVDTHQAPPTPRKLDSRTLSAEVIRSGQALLINADSDASATTLPAGVKFDVGLNAQDWLGVPLRTTKTVIGALVVQSYSGDVRYTAKDLELLQFVSTQIATAIERKQLDAWLRHIARHDPLTGLPNRALVHDRLQAALVLARADGARLAVMYLDLDMFKQVNDSFGHATGDLLLQETARRLRECVGDSGVVGRIGGDEFLVLIEDRTVAADPLAIAENIRASLGRPFLLSEPADHPLRVSPSIGIALYPQHGDDYKQLIRHADEAMYAAKKEGGNRAALMC